MIASIHPDGGEPQEAEEEEGNEANGQESRNYGNTNERRQMEAEKKGFEYDEHKRSILRSIHTVAMKTLARFTERGLRDTEICP